MAGDISKVHNITRLFSDRVAQITAANGYLTDIGVKIFRGRRKIDESDMPCIVLIEGDDEVVERSPASKTVVRMRQAFGFEAWLPCDPSNPSDDGHRAVADIKRCLFGAEWWRDAKLISDRTGIQYDGHVILPREDGVGYIMAAVAVLVEFVENVAQP